MACKNVNLEHQLILSAAESLLANNIPFCLFRYPNEMRWALAIPDDILPHEKQTTFWSVPFSKHHSAAKEIKLGVVIPGFINKLFIQKIKSLEVCPPFEEKDLPEETSRQHYFNAISHYLSDIRSGKLSKAILSRVVYADRPADFDVLQCFSRLADAYAGTFVHLLVHPDAGIWLGASPELLLKKRDDVLDVMALAGTQARNANHNYQWRDKEIQEHLMVAQHIERVMAMHHCSLSHKDLMTTVETGKVAHLKTDYRFLSDVNVSLEPLLKDLHPTPAVGGLPVNESMQCIASYEGYDRTYYTGFIGTTDFRSEADFYVNLRCMQVGKQHIAVYAGGGITAGSDPREEWDETVLKSRTMLEHIKMVKECL